MSVMKRLAYKQIIKAAAVSIPSVFLSGCEPVEDTPLPQPAVVIEDNATDPPQPPMAPQTGES